MLTFLFFDGFKDYFTTIFAKQAKELEFMRRLQSLFNQVKIKLFRIKI